MSKIFSELLFAAQTNTSGLINTFAMNTEHALELDRAGLLWDLTELINRRENNFSALFFELHPFFRCGWQPATPTPAGPATGLRAACQARSGSSHQISGCQDVAWRGQGPGGCGAAAGVGAGQT